MGQDEGEQQETRRKGIKPHSQNKGGSRLPSSSNEVETLYVGF